MKMRICHKAVVKFARKEKLAEIAAFHSPILVEKDKGAPATGKLFPFRAVLVFQSASRQRVT